MVLDAVSKAQLFVNVFVGRLHRGDPRVHPHVLGAAAVLLEAGCSALPLRRVRPVPALLAAHVAVPDGPHRPFRPCVAVAALVLLEQIVIAILGRLH